MTLHDDALTVLGAERIGHGTSSAQDADLLAHLTSRTRVSEFHRHVEPLAHVFREATR